jgi:hypothetical protein
MICCLQLIVGFLSSFHLADACVYQEKVKAKLSCHRPQVRLGICCFIDRLVPFIDSQVICGIASRLQRINIHDDDENDESKSCISLLLVIFFIVSAIDQPSVCVLCSVLLLPCRLLVFTLCTVI